MKPLQVWLPWIGYSVGFPEVSRDVRRAQSGWDRHDVFYLLPALQTAKQWTENIAGHPMRVAALPSEHLNAVTVFHVGSNGIVFAPYHPRPIHGSPAGELLNLWLNIDLRNVSIVLALPVEMSVPQVVDGNLCWEGQGLRMEVLSIRLSPGPAFPMELLSHDADRATVEFRWPPEPGRPTSIHPDAESADWIFQRLPADRNDVPGAVDPETGVSHPHIQFLWPPPFDVLLGPATGFDVMQALADMRTIARDGDRLAALARAQSLAADYLAPGHSTLELSTFWPTALQVHRPGEPLKSFWETFGIRARSLEEAMKDPKLTQPVPVVRAWGGLGMLWALLIARLESATPIRSCERCGRFLDGRRTVCGKKDNTVCYNARRSEDQRRSRR